MKFTNFRRKNNLIFVAKAPAVTTHPFCRFSPATETGEKCGAIPKMTVAPSVFVTCAINELLGECYGKLNIDSLAKFYYIGLSKRLRETMKEKKTSQDTNEARRKFLKKMAATAIFVTPTIRSFNLMAGKNPPGWWTGHHHGPKPGDT